MLRHYQSANHFAMDQRPQLEIAGWKVLNFSGNPMPDKEIVRERAKILRTQLVGHDRDYVYFEDLISNETGVVDPQRPILAKVTSLFEVLWLGGSYDLVEQLLAEFFLSTNCMNIEVCCSRNQVLVGVRICSINYTYRLRKITYVFSLVIYFCSQYC